MAERGAVSRVGRPVLSRCVLQSTCRPPSTPPSSLPAHLPHRPTPNLANARLRNTPAIPLPTHQAPPTRTNSKKGLRPAVKLCAVQVGWGWAAAEGESCGRASSAAARMEGRKRDLVRICEETGFQGVKLLAEQNAPFHLQSVRLRKAPLLASSSRRHFCSPSSNSMSISHLFRSTRCFVSGLLGEVCRREQPEVSQHILHVF